MHIRMRTGAVVAGALVAITGSPLAAMAATSAAPGAATSSSPLFSATTTSGSFSPNGDQVGDTIAVYGEADLSAQGISVAILDSQGHQVRSINAVMFLHDGVDAQGNRITEDRYVATWDGRTTAGKIVKPGTYAAHVTTTSPAGSNSLDTPIVVVRSAKVNKTRQANLGTSTSAVTFDHPVTQGSMVGGDAYVSPGASISLSVVDTAGKLLYGPVSVGHRFPFYAMGVTWSGQLNAGGTAPTGKYVMVATSADGVVTKLPVVLKHS